MTPKFCSPKNSLFLFFIFLAAELNFLILIVDFAPPPSIFLAKLCLYSDEFIKA